MNSDYRYPEQFIESIKPKGKNEIFSKHFHSSDICLECTYTQHINIVADGSINIFPKSEWLMFVIFFVSLYGMWQYAVQIEFRGISSKFIGTNSPI